LIRNTPEPGPEFESHPNYVNLLSVFQNVRTFAASKKNRNMKKNEEYVKNPGRDWLMFIVSTIGMIALLIWLPEWIWVAWPFQFTALAGALGRL
jgi:flagellar biosynthesis protein FlhB